MTLQDFVATYMHSIHCSSIAARTSLFAGYMVLCIINISTVMINDRATVSLCMMVCTTKIITNSLHVCYDAVLNLSHAATSFIMNRLDQTPSRIYAIIMIIIDCNVWCSAWENIVFTS